MIREDAPMVNALCNHEVLRRIDELDENYTRKMMKQLRKAENKDASKDSERTKMDVAEVYSPQRMAAMAAKLGFSQGFSHGFSQRLATKLQFGGIARNTKVTSPVSKK